MSRRARRTVVVVLVLLGLLVAADFGLAAAAEYQVSQKMRERLELSEDPSVTVRGFPFTTQALAGDYPEVVVSAERIRVGPLREVGLQATLHHVRIGIGDLLGSGSRTLRVDEAVGAVRVNGDDLGRQLPGVKRLSIETLDADALAKEAEKSQDPELGSLEPERVVRLVATVSDQQDVVTVLAVLGLAGGQVQIVPRDIRIGDDATPLPRPLQTLLRERFTVRLSPGELPFKVTPTRARTVDGIIEVSGVTRDLVIGEGATGG